MLDQNSPVMCGDCGHNVLPFQFALDEIFCAIELYTAVTVDFADKGDAAPSDRECQVTAAVNVLIKS